MDRLNTLKALYRRATGQSAAAAQPPAMPANPLQRPGFLFLPGLPSEGWHETSIFSWVPRLEAGHPDIRRELDAYLAGSTRAFQGYASTGKQFWEGGRWDALYFDAYGKRYDDTCENFPETWKLLQSIPRRTGTTFFSCLTPGTHILPHHGIANTKLVCHLGVTVPPGLEFRVGKEIRTWQEGKCLAFDDTFEHEVWHRGTQNRVALLFEVYHPDLSDEEVALLEAMETTVFAPSIRHLHQIIDASHAKAFGR